MRLAQTPANRQPVHARKHPIQQNQLRAHLFNHSQSRGSIESLENRVALRFKVRAQEVGKRYIIFNNKNRRHARLILQWQVSAQPLLR